jgi:murein DD-endopeptidase MepM/ murein hydrolase activator NlpD
LYRVRGWTTESGCGWLAVVACAVSLLSPAVVLAAKQRRSSRAPARKSTVHKPKARPSAKRAPRKVAPRAKRRTVQPAPATALRHGSRGTSDEHVHLRRGDTLETILAARGVGMSEARPWLKAASALYDLRRIQPRRGLTLRFDRATRQLEGIRYEMDDRSLLVLERTEDGIQARRPGLPYFTEVKGIAGRIDRGLREDAAQAGVPPSIVSEMADIFGWEIDVANDLRPGDEFRILYENIWLTGEPHPQPGRVLGAEVVAESKPYMAVYFEDPEGRGGYYDPAGEALTRELLRYPVEFTEITSEFSLLRRHPLLRRRRPHLGVDFAAPVGTPVRAVAPGTVLFSGWGGQLGRQVRIAHPGNLDSTYGHLNAIAPGIQEGARVERGQVIGYVGATGLATGPHLHFALSRGDEFIDPLTVDAAPSPGVPELARRAFDRARRAVTRRLAALPELVRPVTVSLSDAELRGE